MEFAIPTNKVEMYDTLKEIFKFYRTTKPVYEESDLEEMVIPALTFTPKSASEILYLASQNLTHKHLRETNEVRNKFQQEIETVTKAIQNYQVEKENKIKEIETKYAELISENKIDALDRGVEYSSIAIRERNKLMQKKESEINSVEGYFNVFKAEKQAQLSTLNARLNVELNNLQQVHNNENIAEANKLSAENDKLVFEYQKYNNSVYEKNLKYKNAMVQTKANLELKFLEVHKEYTSTELVNMGYYTDVLACVFGYYDTMSAEAAYNDIVREQDLIYYLDTYHTTVVNLYKIRASS